MMRLRGAIGAGRSKNRLLEAMADPSGFIVDQLSGGSDSGRLHAISDPSEFIVDRLSG